MIEKKYNDHLHSRIKTEWKPVLNSIVESTKEHLNGLTPKEFKNFQINHYTERLNTELNKPVQNKLRIHFLKYTLKCLKVKD